MLPLRQVVGQLEDRVLVGLPDGLGGDLGVQPQRHEIGDREGQDAGQVVGDGALAEVGDLLPDGLGRQHLHRAVGRVDRQRQGLGVAVGIVVRLDRREQPHRLVLVADREQDRPEVVVDPCGAHPAVGRALRLLEVEAGQIGLAAELHDEVPGLALHRPVDVESPVELLRHDHAHQRAPSTAARTAAASGGTTVQPCATSQASRSSSISTDTAIRRSGHARSTTYSPSSTS